MEKVLISCWFKADASWFVFILVLLLKPRSIWAKKNLFHFLVVSLPLIGLPITNLGVLGDESWEVVVSCSLTCPIYLGKFSRPHTTWAPKKDSWGSEIPLLQGHLGWWNILHSLDGFIIVSGEIKEFSCFSICFETWTLGTCTRPARNFWKVHSTKLVYQTYTTRIPYFQYNILDHTCSVCDTPFLTYTNFSNARVHPSSVLKVLAASSLNLVANFLWSHCWVFKRLHGVLHAVECSNWWSTVKHPFKTEGERSQQTPFLVKLLVFVRLGDATVKICWCATGKTFFVDISKVIPNSISITSIFHYSWLNIFSRYSLKKWYSSLFSPPPPWPASPVLERFKWLRQPSNWPLWRIIPVTRKWFVTQWWSLLSPKDTSRVVWPLPDGINGF